MDRFADRAAGFDLVQVQHEFGLFCGSGRLRESILRFGRLLSALKEAGRPGSDRISPNSRVSSI